MDQEPIPEPRPGRRWTFRLLAITLGFAPFLIAEAGLRIAGRGQRTELPERYIDFVARRPLFERTASGDRYEIPAARQPFFKPDGFAAQKGTTEFRIFCFGGSTVQGNPYSIETSFTTWLELNLRAADPGREWQVVNCGGISYASYRLAPIVRECLQYQPDLFVVCTGHNEFLEDRSYGHLKRLPRWLARVDAALAHVRLCNVARQFWSTAREPASRPRPQLTVLAAEVDALLDYRGGLEWYHRDDGWRGDVVDHFRATLRQMVDEPRAAGVPVILVDPVEPAKDCPPFKVQLDGQLSGDERQRFSELLAAAGSAEDAPDRSVEHLQSALAIDDRHAGAWFLLGRARLARGDDDEARQAFVRAKDEDICPLRAIEALHDVIQEVARSTGAPLVPTRQIFEQLSPQRIPGDEWLLDHIHPSISGHQKIADALLDVLVERGVATPQAGWRDVQQRLHREHLATLDAPYFARGQEHLEGLRKWAQGRVAKLRPAGR